MEDHKRTLSLLYDMATLALAYGVLVVAAQLGAGTTGMAAPFWALKAFKANWPTWWIATLGGAFIVGAIALGLNPFRSAGEYGYARFATLRDLKKWGLVAATGVILGTWRGRYIRTEEPLSIIVAAPPDSGKTAGIVIPNLLSCGNSLLVTDVKGELYEKTHKHRQKFSKVVLFAPGEDNSAGWNPFSKVELPPGWDDVVVRVGQVAATLYAPDKADGNPIWLNGGRSVFTLFALYLIHKHGETSIPRVRSFALSTPDPQRLMADIADEPGSPQRVKEEAYKFITLAEETWGGFWSNFNERLDVFADPRVARNLDRSDFTSAELRQHRLTVYAKISTADLLRLTPVLGIFMESTCLHLISRERGPGEFKVTYLLDEFARLPVMQALINMPALSRSYGVNAMFVFQSESQVVERYGQKALESLKNTTAYHIYFSSNEPNSAEIVSRAIGPRTRKKLSFATSESRITRNTNETNEGVPLVSAQDVMNLPFRTILILKQQSFAKPILAKDARWYLDGALKPLVI